MVPTKSIECWREWKAMRIVICICVDDFRGQVNEHVQCANADAELPNEDFGQCTENNACQFVVAEAMHRFNLLQSQCLCVSHQCFIRSFCGGEDCTEVGTELGLVYLEPNMSELRPYLSESVWEKLNSGIVSQHIYTELLLAGSQFASKIQTEVQSWTNYICQCGVGTNKVVARLAAKSFCSARMCIPPRVVITGDEEASLMKESLYSTNEHEPNDGTDESSLWRPENILRESKWRSSFPSHNNGEKLTDDVTGSLHCNCLLCVQIRTMSYDILKKAKCNNSFTHHQWPRCIEMHCTLDNGKTLKHDLDFPSRIDDDTLNCTILQMATGVFASCKCSDKMISIAQFIVKEPSKESSKESSKDFGVVENHVYSTSLVPQKREREEEGKQLPLLLVNAQTSAEKHAEMEANTSFVFSLTPKLREEVLLTADEVFLSTLPESLISEARRLQRRQKKVWTRRSMKSSSPLVMKCEGKAKNSTVKNNNPYTGQAEQVEEVEGSHQEQRSIGGGRGEGGPVKLSELLPLLCNDSEGTERFLLSRDLYTTAQNLFSDIISSSKNEEETTDIQ